MKTLKTLQYLQDLNIVSQRHFELIAASARHWWLDREAIDALVSCIEATQDRGITVEEILTTWEKHMLHLPPFLAKSEDTKINLAGAYRDLRLKSPFVPVPA